MACSVFRLSKLFTSCNNDIHDVFIIRSFVVWSFHGHHVLLSAFFHMWRWNGEHQCQLICSICYFTYSAAFAKLFHFILIVSTSVQPVAIENIELLAMVLKSLIHGPRKNAVWFLNPLGEIHESFGCGSRNTWAWFLNPSGEIHESSVVVLETHGQDFRIARLGFSNRSGVVLESLGCGSRNTWAWFLNRSTGVLESLGCGSRNNRVWFSNSQAWFSNRSG